MSREENIQKIVEMLLKATDEQLKKLRIFIEAFLRPGM